MTRLHKPQKSTKTCHPNGLQQTTVHVRARIVVVGLPQRLRLDAGTTCGYWDTRSAAIMSSLLLHLKMPRKLVKIVTRTKSSLRRKLTVVRLHHGIGIFHEWR